MIFKNIDKFIEFNNVKEINIWTDEFNYDYINNIISNYIIINDVPFNINVINITIDSIINEINSNNIADIIYLDDLSILKILSNNQNKFYDLNDFINYKIIKKAKLNEINYNTHIMPYNDNTYALFYIDDIEKENTLSNLYINNYDAFLGALENISNITTYYKFAKPTKDDILFLIKLLASNLYDDNGDIIINKCHKIIDFYYYLNNLNLLSAFNKYDYYNDINTDIGFIFDSYKFINKIDKDLWHIRDFYLDDTILQNVSIGGHSFLINKEFIEINNLLSLIYDIFYKDNNDLLIDYDNIFEINKEDEFKYFIANLDNEFLDNDKIINFDINKIDKISLILKELIEDINSYNNIEDMYIKFDELTNKLDENLNTNSIKISAEDIIINYIDILKMPNKITYHEGELFDPTGMITILVTKTNFITNSKIINCIFNNHILKKDDNKITLYYYFNDENKINIYKKTLILNVLDND